MSYYSNPTENAAIGAVEKELKQMRKYAKRVKKLHRLGLLQPEDEARLRRHFSGIYRPLLLSALSDEAAS